MVSGAEPSAADHLCPVKIWIMYLYLLNDGLELSRSLHPDVHQLHGSVKVLHVLAVHLQEGGQLL